MVFLLSLMSKEQRLAYLPKYFCALLTAAALNQTIVACEALMVMALPPVLG
jgi:hypothetical protein